MDRRETLKGLGMLIGGSLLPQSVLADFLRISASVKQGGKWSPRFIPIEHAALLPELVEVIIPATDTPGAKDALVHVFVDLYVKDCYPAAQQAIFLKGLDSVQVASHKRLSLSFLEVSKKERLGLLELLEKESWDKQEPTEQSFIKMLKNVTVLGYFSSQPGATKAAEYEPSPGPFQGCIDMKPRQKVDAM